MSTIRVRLDLGYDGTDFAGWASQPGLRTVQGTLEAALGTVLRCAPPRLTVAGRTDAGVHARRQVAHLDLDREVWRAVCGRIEGTPGQILVRRLAGVLPADVVVHAASEAPLGFDARFSPVARRYVYRVADDPTAVDPLRRAAVLRHRMPLDAASMHAAAQPLVGLHDFAAYCKPRPGATTIRTVLALAVARHPDGAEGAERAGRAEGLERSEGADTGLVTVTIEADAFCHSMVRSIVGALLAVGEGRRPQAWPGELLAARTRAATVAPPQGLSLETVVFPPDGELAVRAEQTRARRAPVAPAGTPASEAGCGCDDDPADDPAGD